MKLLRNRIKHLLDELKIEKKNTIDKQNQDYCIINLLFNTDLFNDKCYSIGDFMKKLKNGKISYNSDYYFGRPKQNNREYFNDLIGDGGFYRYNYGYKFIELNIFLNLKGDIDYSIDKEIIKSRISKIIKPIECNIGFNDELLLNKTFRDLSILDTGWSLFGYNLNDKTNI